jgi:hypothetical protein
MIDHAFWLLVEDVMKRSKHFDAIPKLTQEATLCRSQHDPGEPGKGGHNSRQKGKRNSSIRWQNRRIRCRVDSSSIEIPEAREIKFTPSLDS